MTQSVNISLFGKTFFQQCGHEVSKLAEPLLETASQNPRGLLAISGGFAVLSGAQVLRASRVPSAVRSWFWSNEREEIPPPCWGMAIAGASSMCLGACAVAMAILGFSDPTPPQTAGLEISESYDVCPDSGEESLRDASCSRLVSTSDSDRCEAIGSKDSFSQEFSYLSHPGYHALHLSPIAESRVHEYKMLCDAARHPIQGRIFRELGQNLYHDPQTKTFPFTIIEPKRCGEAGFFADQLYSRFLDPYRSHGVNENNAVNYEFISGCGRFKSFAKREHLHCGDAESGRKCEFLTFVQVCIGQLSPPHKPDSCFPDSLVAIHELMHAQELPVIIHQDLNSDLFDDISEIMTVTKSIINADEIAKKLDGIDLAVERDYGQKSYLIDGCRIPLGKFANFYRELEKEEQSLAHALVSEKSIRFLTCADGLPHGSSERIV